MSDDAHLISDRHPGWIELTLNRPQRRNALSRALIADLTTALRSGGADDEVRAVILCGAPPAFSAGLGLREVAESTHEQAEHDASCLLELFETVDGLRKPVIAA